MSRPKRPEGELLAAVDMGSNSFHMIVARHELGGLRVIDRHREMVRLAAGVDAEGNLSTEARERAFGCLERMGQRLRSLPHERVRAVATNAVRQLRAPAAFLLTAETALGHPIEVVSGREEARLIYLGVANGLPPRDTQRLVVDIGGGSTEFIIGRGFEPLERESLQVGCVATTMRFFEGGKLNEKRWRHGLTEISVELQQFAAPFRQLGWEEAIGSSGTAKAIAALLANLRLHEGGIIAEGLTQLRERMLAFGSIDRIDLPGLSDERRPVLPGGLLVMEAVFRVLGLAEMKVCETAMREGLLYDMLGRASDQDPRDASIAALAARYGVDVEQAQRVEATALRLFEQVSRAWQLGPTERDWLQWAARVHELGLAIAHSQHHQHGAYVIEHADLAGFSQQEQQVLALMIRGQRRKVAEARRDTLPERLLLPTLRCMLLLRLAILLHRSRDAEALPAMDLSANGNELVLTLPARWLDRHALTRIDLDTERGYLAAVGVNLAIQRS
jgi:exopolyphosphatase / guanosine-5'-triphosphate,3'-diphosphate pyrophosphatase